MVIGNGILKLLKSGNVLDISIGLQLVSRLKSPDLTLLTTDMILVLLRHSDFLVRFDCWNVVKRAWGTIYMDKIDCLMKCFFMESHLDVVSIALAFVELIRNDLQVDYLIALHGYQVALLNNLVQESLLHRHPIILNTLINTSNPSLWNMEIIENIFEKIPAENLQLFLSCFLRSDKIELIPRGTLTELLKASFQWKTSFITNLSAAASYLGSGIADFHQELSDISQSSDDYLRRQALKLMFKMATTENMKDILKFVLSLIESTADHNLAEREFRFFIIVNALSVLGVIEDRSVITRWATQIVEAVDETWTDGEVDRVRGLLSDINVEDLPGNCDYRLRTVVINSMETHQSPSLSKKLSCLEYYQRSHDAYHEDTHSHIPETHKSSQSELADSIFKSINRK